MQLQLAVWRPRSVGGAGAAKSSAGALLGASSSKRLLESRCRPVGSNAGSVSILTVSRPRGVCGAGAAVGRAGTSAVGSAWLEEASGAGLLAGRWLLIILQALVGSTIDRRRFWDRRSGGWFRAAAVHYYLLFQRAQRAREEKDKPPLQLRSLARLADAQCQQAQLSWRCRGSCQRSGRCELVWRSVGGRHLEGGTFSWILQSFGFHTECGQPCLACSIFSTA